MLRDIKPQKDFFIGVDSDGCVFDTMEIKQKECFIPNTIKYWNLQPISKYVRETEEFVNLYSSWRGMNRFPALLMVFDLLKDRPEVLKREFKMPEVGSLRDWIKKEPKLGNPSLKDIVEEMGDAVLKKTLQWSEAVNKAVSEIVKDIPPFSFAKKSLVKAQEKADLIVVSTTPNEALEREWDEHKLAQYVRAICGQELGKKRKQLELASGGKYKKEHILMVGDALGDMQAARENDALFYPINPGREDESWEKFYNEALDRFFAEEYAGTYELRLIGKFEKYLPSIPPWKK
ncbi:MAG: HAD hydrolase-like protein [Candidatus Omnitrophica bacterium]|nr:HAD hydrolase-like protein [Candidatus Omnitrophota bacterium]MBU1047205.1 HAD hydrolase-like protein [Candidatus Omnitrophota bacterium]MBU1630742.1 HAD hydrolase-like protein [Candidatus Omnitrophota bacterium]MBU1889505.1 HAD hydrolase-like protein [Candidatus Omnitrophota bacterium]